MRVLVGGVFDIIHPGHIFFLEKAAEQGDELVVVVATDETAEKFKQHKPIMGQPERLEIVGALEPVSRAVPGTSGDFLDIVETEKPGIIVLGYDQKFPNLENDLAKRGFETTVVRLGIKHGDYSTTRILERINE